MNFSVQVNVVPPPWVAPIMFWVWAKNIWFGRLRTVPFSWPMGPDRKVWQQNTRLGLRRFTLHSGWHGATPLCSLSGSRIRILVLKWWRVHADGTLLSSSPALELAQ